MKLYNPWPDDDGEWFKLKDVRIIRECLREGLSLKQIADFMQRRVSDIDLMLWRNIAEPLG